MPTNLPPLPAPGSGIEAWIAWAIIVVIFGGGFIAKAWWEKRGGSPNALADERAAHRETKAELAKTQQLLEESRQRENALVREFSEMRASAAKMELQIQYLTEEVAELRAEVLRGKTA